MNKAILFIALVCGLFFSTQGTVFAQSKGGFAGGPVARGGFSGPGPAVVTVEEARRLRDDSHVLLRGSIIQYLGKDKYLFKDASGTITVEIDDDEWEGQTVSPSDVVEIYGKVDKDWNSTEVDVKRLIKQ